MLAEHERDSGIVPKILSTQDAIKEALGRLRLKLLLDYEALLLDRTGDSERIAYNLGFEHGFARGRSEQLDHPDAQRLAVAIRELILRMSVGEAAVLQALAGLLAGMVGR